MARTQRSRLGIELSELHIRIVEVTVSQTSPQVLAAAEAPMPAGAIVNGALVLTDAIAFAIRELKDRMGATTNDAVVGVPSAGTTLRTLTLPPATGEELERLIAGEVEHFGIIVSDGSAYDTFAMPAARGADGGGSLSVLLMAAEGPEIASIRYVTSRADVIVEALEPVNLGMYRAAVPALAGSPGAVVLTISDARSDIVMHSKGEICVYRRLDVGTNALVLRRGGDDAFQDAKDAGDAENKVGFDTRKVGLGPANTLALELKRSVEFFQREYQDEKIDKLVVVATEAYVDEMVPWLSGVLGMPAQMLDTITTPTQKDGVKREISKPTGAKYMTAYGLAMRGLVPGNVPTMDLFVKGRTEVARQVQRKGIAWTLLACIAILLFTIAVSYVVGLKANAAEHELFHEREDIEGQQAYLKQFSDQDMKVRNQYTMLKADGVPLGQIIDLVTRDVAGPMGLSGIVVDKTGKIHLNGDAHDENEVIAAADKLKADPLIKTSGVSSISQVDPEKASAGLNFTIDATGWFGKQEGKTP
jgi:Tfp pilus assembly PilM family ATPase